MIRIRQPEQRAIKEKAERERIKRNKEESARRELVKKLFDEAREKSFTAPLGYDMRWNIAGICSSYADSYVHRSDLDVHR